MQLQRASPASRIIVFAASLDPDQFSALDDLQIVGHLLWSDLSVETLPHILAAVMAGDVVVGTPTVAQAFIATQCRPAQPRPGAVQLTARERVVVRRLAAGLSHKEIATVEGMSPRTVDRIVADLYEKLDAPTAFALGVKAAQLGLVP